MLQLLIVFIQSLEALEEFVKDYCQECKDLMQAVLKLELESLI